MNINDDLYYNTFNIYFNLMNASLLKFLNHVHNNKNEDVCLLGCLYDVSEERAASVIALMEPAITDELK